MSVAEKMVAIHDGLKGADVPHAFGGALALAWCTQEARGTIDIDLNLFVGPEDVEKVLAAIPAEVVATKEDHDLISRDGQTRLWWENTPVDVFFNTTPFHVEVGERVRWEPFAGRNLPFLSCRDLAVFKVFFNRTKDWADLEAMADAMSLDVDYVLGVVVRLLGGTDERVERLRSLAIP